MLGLALLIYTISWLGFNWDIFFSSHLQLPRDAWITNFPMFRYVSEWLRQYGGLPPWFFSKDGGVWFEALSNVYMTLLPSRILGHLLAWKTSIPLVTLYKVSFLFGIGLFLFGIFLLAKELFKSRNVALLTVFFFLTCGSTLGIFHQEQVLGTILYLPYLWYFLIKAVSRPRYFLVVASLLGLSLNLHYPHLVMLYSLSILFCAAFLRRELARHFTAIPWKTGLLAVLLFGVSSSPLFYTTIKYRNDLSSQFRHLNGRLGVASYSDYVRQPQIKFSSLLLEDLPLYFKGYSGHGLFTNRPLDDKIAYAGPALALVFFLVFFLAVPFKGFQLSLIGLLGLLSLGVNVGTPRFLWYLVPEIDIFRQWYHFTPILTAHLVFLSIFTLRALVTAEPKEKHEKALFWGAGALLCGFSLFKVLPPLHGFVPGVLLIVLPFLKEKRFLVFFLPLWVFIANLHYVLRTTEEIRVYMPAYQAPTNSFTEEVFGKGLTHRLNANPRNSNLDAIRGRAEKGGLQFVSVDKKAFVLPVENISVTSSLGELKIKIDPIPKDTTFLNLLQYNDGQWRAYNQGGILLQNTGLEDGTVLIKKGTGTRSIEIRREVSLWYWLVLFSFSTFPVALWITRPQWQFQSREFDLSRLRLSIEGFFESLRHFGKKMAKEPTGSH